MSPFLNCLFRHSRSRFCISTYFYVSHCLQVSAQGRSDMSQVRTRNKYGSKMEWIIDGNGFHRLKSWFSDMRKGALDERLDTYWWLFSTVVNRLPFADAVHRTHCRSTDCETSGTKAPKCSVFTSWKSLFPTLQGLCFCTRKDSCFN